MKKLALYLALLLLNQTAFSQSDTIFLKNLLQAAREHSTATSRLKIGTEISEMKIENAGTGNLPFVSAYGKAWYQSDAITVITPAGPGLEIDRFQYNAGFEANQKLFDGGMVKRNREMELAGLNAQTDKIETELYQLSDRVVELFYQAVYLGKKLQIILLKKEILDKRLAEMAPAFENGMVKRNDLEKLQAEKLHVGQELLGTEQLRLQILLRLSEITGIGIPEHSQLKVSDSLMMAYTAVRPEVNYFESEYRRLESIAHLQQGANLPKLYAFGQLGYSYPGLNFFENQSDYYYMLGAKLSWTILDWNKNKRQVQLIRKQQEIVDTQRTDFERNMDVSIRHEMLEQDKLLRLIEMDSEIIGQRSLISKGSETALSNGVITTSDYLEDLNSELQARLEMELHKLQLENSKVRLKLLEGINIISLN